MVRLNKLNIDFDCNKENPYFQASTNQRIRFGMEDLTPSLIRKIVEDTFSENDNISVILYHNISPIKNVTLQNLELRDL